MNRTGHLRKSASFLLVVPAAMILALAPSVLADAVIDVTAKVISAVRGNALQITASNGVFSDPAKGRPKQLKVEYAVGETVLTNIVTESQVLSIEAPPGKRLIILKAVYGFFADEPRKTRD